MAQPAARKKKTARLPKGYSRVDSDKTNSHGWLVRIRRGGKMKSRFISDATYGGKNKARRVAAELYAKWSAELPPMQTCVGKMSVRNATGVVGVHYANDGDSRYPNCSYESYIASWVDENGKRAKLGFSCNRYGKDAFDLACIAREKRLTDRAKVQAILQRRAQSKAAGRKPRPTGKAARAKLSSSTVSKKPAKKK